MFVSLSSSTRHPFDRLLRRLCFVPPAFGTSFFFSLPLTSIQTRQICHSCSLSYLNVFLRLCIDLNQRDLTMKRRLVCVRVPANGGKVFNV